MPINVVPMYVISCDWPGCGARTSVPRVSKHEAFCDWRTGFNGMQSLAGRYDSLEVEAEAYLCGEHYHVTEGRYHRGPAVAAQEVALRPRSAARRRANSRSAST